MQRESSLFYDMKACFSTLFLEAGILSDQIITRLSGVILYLDRYKRMGMIFYKQRNEFIKVIIACYQMINDSGCCSLSDDLIYSIDNKCLSNKKIICLNLLIIHKVNSF